MLELVEVSSFLTKQLNTYSKGKTPSYEFDIRAEVGKYENNSVVYGVLRSNKPILPPVAGVKNIKYSLSVKLQVVAPLVNFNLKNIESVIGEFVENWNGKEVEFGKGKGLLNLTLTSTEGFKTESGQGNIVPIEFDIGINYTENVITSGTKHWLLDGIEIPFLSERLIVERNGKTSPVNDRSYQQTFLTNQTKLYNFTFIYDTTNELCAMLQKDLLEGELNKTYKLEFYDGVSFTKEKPFSAIVSILRTGDSSSQKPDNSMFNITFVDADDGENKTKYYMALIDFPFDEQSEDTPYFKLEWQKIEYFEKMIKKGARFEEIKAPNLNSIDLTNQIYVNNNGYDLFDLVNKNYAIIKADKNGELYYFFYWIRDCQIGAENQLIYDLHIDSVQSYYFRNQINIQGSFIEKASLDRWEFVYEQVNLNISDKPKYEMAFRKGYYVRYVDEITSEVEYIHVDKLGLVDYEKYGKYEDYDVVYEQSLRFDFSKTSKLFEREELKNVAKRLVSRQKLNYYMNGWYKLNQKPHESIALNSHIYYYKDEETGTLKSTYGMFNGDYNELEEVFVKKQTIIDEFPTVWCYIFLDSKSYKFKNSNGEEEDVTLNKASIGVDGGFETPTTILCYPVDKDIFIRVNQDDMLEDVRIGMGGWNAFENLNPDDVKSSYIKGIKLSLKPPFNLTQLSFYNIDLRYTEDEMAFIPWYSEKTELTLHHGLSAFRTASMLGLLYLEKDYGNEVALTCKNKIVNLKFKKDDVKKSQKDKKFNPKLNSSDYKSLNLTIAGSSFEMPIDKINIEKPVFYYYEALTPEVTKGFLRLGYLGDENEELIPLPVEDVENSIFGKDYRESFNGFSYSNDFTIAFAKEVYSEYIANNKNAYLSFQAQQSYNRDVQNMSNEQQAVNGALSATNSLSKLDFGGAVTQATNTALNVLYSEAKFRAGQSLRQTQFDLSIDNMRNAPNTMTNLNGSAILTQMIAKFGIYLEVYEALDHELEVANDMMFRNGYTYNRFDNIKSGISKPGVDQIRKRFNYVKAILGSISGIPISNSARADLRQRFADGIRFWSPNSDGEFVVDYSIENYELKLD